MSYKIYAGTSPRRDRQLYQVFGNNEFPNAIYNYMEQHGCKFDEDGCFKSFEIKDINGFINAMFVYHKQVVKDNFWDLKPYDPIDNPIDLIDHL